MRILVFYQYFGTPKGSWSTRVYELTRRWVSEGHKITVVTAPYEKSDIKTDSFIDRQCVEGIDLIVINSADSNKNSVLKRVIKALIFSGMSLYYALREPCDVVISSSGPITVGVPGLVAKWFRRKPLIFEVRDLWPLGAIELGKIKSPLLIKIGKWFEELCYRNSSLIVPCSVGMEKGVLKIYKKAKTLVIPNASDPDLFYKEKKYPYQFPNQLKDKKIFLYAGSLGLMDDCNQIIRGMNYVHNENIALVFLGDGAERKDLEKLASQMNNKNIFFMGLVPKTEVVKWMSISVSTFVTFKDFPVLHTSSPNKMFDSFAAGIPIIQSTKGWIKELVEKERCGVNVRPDVPADFAKAMNHLVEDNSFREELVRNAKRLSNEVFNRDLLAKKYLEKIQKIYSS